MDYINPLDFIKPQVVPAAVIGQIRSDCVVVKTSKFSPRSVFSNHITRIEESKLQLGYGFYLFEGLPRKVFNIVKVLRDHNCIAGFDIDHDGFVTYDEEDI